MLSKATIRLFLSILREVADVPHFDGKYEASTFFCVYEDIHEFPSNRA